MDDLKQKYLGLIADASDEAAVEELRVQAVGKKGEISLQMRELGKMTPEEPPIVWLNSLPSAGISCVRSAKGILSMEPFNDRAAVARVLPVSPSPDFASSVFNADSESINKSQIDKIVCRVSGLSDAIGSTGAKPSGRRSTVTLVRR